MLFLTSRSSQILLHRQFGEKEDDVEGLDDTEEKTLPEFVIGERITITPPTTDSGGRSGGVEVAQVRGTLMRCHRPSLGLVF